MENQPSDREKAIQELCGGHESANQLLEILQNTNGNEGSTPVASDLVQKILRSFTNALFFLNTDCEVHEVSEILKGEDSPSGKVSKSEDLYERWKSSTIEVRRGCYKRRRTSQTWQEHTSTLIEDGHDWRKYGQKMIQNAKYLRKYYRCSHKYNQGCQAIKQVQRIQEDPPLYRTTYYDHHTCRRLLSPEIILTWDSPSDSSVLLSFDNTLQHQGQDHPLIPSSFSSPEKEIKQEIPQYYMAHNGSSLISSVMKFESAEQKDAFEPFGFQ